MKIGIIGLGAISHRVAKGIQYAKNAQLYAVASRDKAKAEAFKETYQAKVSYDSYEALYKDENIDMVYICTPNHLHYEHIMKALSYGIHVLCEKPLVSNMEQLKACFAYAKEKECFLMEAEKTLFTPLNQEIRKLIEAGEIGKLQYIEGSYSYAINKQEMGAHHWAFSKEAGGSMYDVGVYPICYANYFANSSLMDIKAIKESTKEGYDMFAQALLTYENGVRATVRSGWNIWMENKGFLYGDKGVIITENFWKNTRAILRKGEKDIEIVVHMESDFTGEIEHACTCIAEGKLQSPIMSMQASMEIMKVLEYIKKIEN